MMYFHYIYDEENDILRVLEYPSNRLFLISQHKIRTEKYNHHYALPKQYQLSAKERDGMTMKERNDYYKKQLMQYSQDFQKLNNDLLYNGYLRIDYSKYYCDSSAITSTFKRLCPKYSLFKPVNTNEYKWIKKCKGGGLVYFNENEKNSKKQCYGYDFKKFYPFCMTKIKIPVCGGEEKVLEKLPEKQHFGYYRLYIRCKDERITKVFSFSTDNIYTNYSLYHLKFLKEEIGINIKFDLIQDGKPNAYLYRNEDLISGEELFGNWYRTLSTVEERLPCKNLLLKCLMSRLWGCLMSTEKRYLNEDDYNKEQIPSEKIMDIKVKGDPLNAELTYVVVSDPNDIYKQGGVGRVGVFLHEYARAYMGKIIAKHCLDSVIKIQTDGFVTSERINYNKKLGFYNLLKFDSKYYGVFKIGGINNFEKV